MPTIRPIALLVMALALAACGTSPTGAKWTRPTKPEPTATAPADPAPPPSPGAPAGSAAELIERGYASFSAMSGYETEMHYMQKKGAKTSTGIYLIAGKQPRKVRIIIKEGNSQGTKLLWEGGDKIKVRPTGFLSAVTVDLPLTDDRFKSVRGYTLNQSDVVAMFTMMRDPANKAELSGAGFVTLTGPKLMPGTIKMVVNFDATSNLPYKVEASDSKEPVFRMELKNFRSNKNVSLAI